MKARRRIRHLSLGRIVFVGLVVSIVASLFFLRSHDSAREYVSPALQRGLPLHPRPWPTAEDLRRGLPGRAGGLGSPWQQPLNIVDLNNGTLAELETLPGITPDAARRVLAGRPYHAMQDLERVGIPHAIVEQISPPAIIWLNDKGDPTTAPGRGPVLPPAQTGSKR